VTLDQQADDVHRLLSRSAAGSAVFGNSGGTVGLALVTAHRPGTRAGRPRTPPVVELLPDSAQVAPSSEDICATYYRADGAEAWKFFVHVKPDQCDGAGAGAPQWQPSPDRWPACAP
jgi:hypothetical protein